MRSAFWRPAYTRTGWKNAKKRKARKRAVKSRWNGRETLRVLHARTNRSTRAFPVSIAIFRLASDELAFLSTRDYHFAFLSLRSLYTYIYIYIYIYYRIFCWNYLKLRSVVLWQMSRRRIWNPWIKLWRYRQTTESYLFSNKLYFNKVLIKGFIKQSAMLKILKSSKEKR